MATIKIIPANPPAPEVLRVAAYCRVSSDSADQLHSYAVQLRAYTELIESHEGWELVDVYADAGLTGTRMDKRDDFNRMLSDCRHGKIDLVLVKSISRFARNTKDCLETIRELTALGVSVRFEEDHIDTKTLTSELMVSVFGSLAQQESNSISQNQRMSYQRRMERGEFITCKPPYGYRMINGKDMEIVPDEAEEIKWIFQSYLSGMGMEEIANALTAKGLESPDGCPTWSLASVRYILSNEKYIGDALSQKAYTDGFPFKEKINNGERPKYLIHDCHPAIISREDFQRVQALCEKKGPKKKLVHGKYILTRKLRCRYCGAVFQRKESQCGYVTWCCRTANQSKARCANGRVPEQAVYEAFIRMYNRLRSTLDIILTPALEQLRELQNSLYRDNDDVLVVNKRIADTAERHYKLAKLQVDGRLSADVYATKSAELNGRMMKLNRERQELLKYDAVEKKITLLCVTEATLTDGPKIMNEFDEELFSGLIEGITVSDHMLRFHLYGGLELDETV